MLLFIERPTTKISSEDVRWASLEARLDAINLLYARAPWRSFGNEARCALLMRSGLVFPIDKAFSSRHRAGHPSLDRFLIRPAIEPIVYSSWNRFETWDIDEGWAIKFTTMLTSQNAQLRSVSVDKPALGDLPPMKYASLETAPLWLDSLAAIRSFDGLTSLQEACLIHASVVLHHPLSDGNGRLARALFHGSLCSRGRIDAPFLAIGPVMYRASHSYMRAIRRLSQTGSLTTYLDDVRELLDATIATQEQLEDSEALGRTIEGMSEAVLSDQPLNGRF